MPERAAVPLLTALAVGFLCGLIGSVLQLTGGGATALGAAAAAAAALAGAVSLARAPVEQQEKLLVGALRALLAAGTAAFEYVALLMLLRDGSILPAIGLGIMAAVLAILLATVVARSRGASPPTRTRPTV